MKKIAALALALLALAAVAAPTASARHSVAHRLSVLESKVKALQTSVKTLKAQNARTARELACFTGGAPVARFGGYLYDHDNDPATPPVATTALDITGPGETPQAFFALIDQACLTSGRRPSSLFAWPEPIRKAPL